MGPFPVKEDQESVKLRISGLEDRQKLGHDETEVPENDGNREDQILEKPMFEIHGKRRRSEEEEEDEEDYDDVDSQREVNDADDGFKTPTGPENVITKMRQCPPAPRKPKPESSVLIRTKIASCRRQLEFTPEGIESFITNLQRKRTMKKKKKKS